MSLNKLGRYDIIRVLGRGAMGLVYEARDPNLDRRVAIKTIKVENLSEEAAAEYEARFKTEAHSAARLQHPNIVSVYDSDRHGDMAFLVMEFIQGEDLKNHLDGGQRFSLEQSLGMIRELLSALDYAHRQNIVHRDVKPANLLIEADGRIKLTDFGVARIQDSGEVTRTQGSMVGTLKYMSPEQVQGLPVDARADLFAVGIVLYQLLTGKRPFDGDTDFAIIQQIASHTPAAPSVFNPLLPPALDAVVARALAKKRDQRFATAQDFALALQEASQQASDPTIVPPAGQPGRGKSNGSGVQPSRSGGPTVRLDGSSTGSTVTQELELVYWKDIKDSEDIEDLEGFLAHFPDGIYADLARRRLKKLGGRVSAEDSGSGTGTATLAAQTEWTLLQPQNALALAHDFEATQIVTPVTVAVPAPPEPAPASLAQPVKAKASPLVAPTARVSKKPLLVLAGVAVLVVAGLAFKFLPGAPASVNVASPALAAPAPVATPPPPVESPAASPTPPKPPTARVAAPVVAEKPPATRPSPTKPVAAAASPTQAPAAVATSDPRPACEHRMLLGFQICMNEQCAKPGFRGHPVCVERRAMEKLRHEAQDMRN